MEQIRISWLRLSPFVDAPSRGRASRLADVASVPREFFELETLRRVLSYEEDLLHSMSSSLCYGNLHPDKVLDPWQCRMSELVMPIKLTLMDWCKGATCRPLILTGRSPFPPGTVASPSPADRRRPRRPRSHLTFGLRWLLLILKQMEDMTPTTAPEGEGLFIAKGEGRVHSSVLFDGSSDGLIYICDLAIIWCHGVVIVVRYILVAGYLTCSVHDCNV